MRPCCSPLRSDGWGCVWRVARGGKFQPLPAVPDELKGIFKERAEEKQPVTGVAFLDEKFNAKELVRPGRRVNTVHVASHFESLPGDTAN